MSDYLPDDWYAWKEPCPRCGKVYHMTEGSCPCMELEIERQREDLVELIEASAIDFIDYDRLSDYVELDDELGDVVAAKELGVKIYLTQNDGTEIDLTLSRSNYQDLKRAVKKLPPIDGNN